MTSKAQELLREALTLPIDERADVAAELLASLDEAGAEDLTEVEAAWAAEIEKRARRVMAGSRRAFRGKMSAPAPKLNCASGDCARSL